MLRVDSPIDAHPRAPALSRIVGGCLYGAGMSTQPDRDDSSPPPDQPPSGRTTPGGSITPHDSVFRRTFGVPENMASELRAVLPPGLAARLDLTRLTPCARQLRRRNPEVAALRPAVHRVA